MNSSLKQLVITDSIELTPQVTACEKIRAVPLAPMLAQAILNTANGTSVSSLFAEDSLGPLYDKFYNTL
jgi:ribose-phosphate pyrophosphokinase